MKLHTSKKSPFARKVEILAQLKGLELEYIEASADGANGYTGGVNPLGKIPALEIPGEGVLADSPVICEYLDALSAPILPKGGHERWHHLHLHALGDGISDAVYNFRYETVRPEALHWRDMQQRHETAILTAIGYLESRVETLGQPWEFGNIAIVCALDYADFRAGHLGWRELAPKLASWHKGFANTDLWKLTYGY